MPMETMTAVRILVELALIGAGSALLAFAWLWGSKRLRAKMEALGNHYLAILLYATRKPGLGVAFLIALFLSAWSLDRGLDLSLQAKLEPVFDFGTVAVMALFLILLVNRLKRLALARLARREGRQAQRVRRVVDIGARALRILVIVVIALICLEQIGINLTNVLAFGGIGGIVVGLAAKDIISNVFGSFIIYLDRPFEVGDWILCESQGLEGTVEKIRWRTTHIRTFDKRLLYVPNTVFIANAVENPSRMTHRRIYETIGVRYEDAGRVAEIVRKVKEMLKTHPEIDPTQTTIVNLNSFAPSSLDFFIYVFTRTTNWIKYHEVKQDVLLKVLEIIEECGAECAFPTSTVLLQGGEAAGGDGGK